MAALEDLADDTEVEDEDEEEVDDTDEDGDEADEGTEVGGGAEGEPDGEQPDAGEPVSGLAQLRALLEDPEIQTTLQDQIADYQARMAQEAMSKQEAEAFQKLIDEEDWAGVGKAVVERNRQVAAQAQARDAVTKELFTPVYRDLLAQPEMQKLSAEDKAKLQVDNFPNHAAHTTAIASYIAEKRFEAQMETEVAKRVEAALTAEKNKETSGKAKAPSLAGRSPASIGVVQPKLSSADLIRSGLRGIIGMNDNDDGDE